MRKKIIVILIFCIYFFSSNVFATIDDLDLSAKYVGVYNANNLEPIYEKGAKDKISIASITKIMTAIVCIENVEDLNSTVIVDLPEVKKYYDEDYSVAGLKDKQEISYYDLIATMLIPSGADSAACIALNVFGDYNIFIDEMNNTAKRLNMSNTSFANPIGSDDENNYSTVEDLSLMMKYALENDTIKEFLSTYEYTTQDKSITVHNALFQLGEIYGINVDKISGGKTGMTEEAQYCLASYSDKLNTPVICIVMNCEIKRGTLYHLSDSQKIYEYLNENYSNKTIIQKGEEIGRIPSTNSIQKDVAIGVEDDVNIYIQNDETIDKEKIEIKYNNIVDTLSSSYKKGDIIGNASIYYDGNYVTDANIVVDEKIMLSLVKWSKNNKGKTIVIEIVLILIVLYIFRKKIFIKKLK